MKSDDPKPILPPFGRIAMVGFAVNAPFLAAFLLTANLKIAVDMIAGYGLALTVYGMLYAIIGQGLDLFSADALGNGAQARSLSAMGFVVLMMGKFVPVAVLLYVLWHTGYMEVLPFIGGFLLAQIGITWMSVSYSKKSLAGVK